MTHTVLIVDDHAGFRRLARERLEPQVFEVVGEAATGKQALEMAARTRPGIVLLDIQLPDADGFAVCRRIRALRPGTVVVLCSVHRRDDFGPKIAECGAAGFVSKERFSACHLLIILGSR